MSEKDVSVILEKIHLEAYSFMCIFKNYINMLGLDRFELGSLNNIDDHGMIKINRKNLMEMFKEIGNSFEYIKNGIENYFSKEKAE